MGEILSTSNKLTRGHIINYARSRNERYGQNSTVQDLVEWLGI